LIGIKKIEIFNRTEKRVIFIYDISNYFKYNFKFLNEEYIIIIINRKKIKIISLIDKKEKEIFDNLNVREFLRSKEYLILNSYKEFNIYDIDFKCVHKIDISKNMNNSIIISDSAKIKIISSNEYNIYFITIRENNSEIGEFKEVDKIKNNIDRLPKQKINNFKMHFLFKGNLNDEKNKNKINDLNIKQHNQNNNGETQVNINEINLKLKDKTEKNEENKNLKNEKEEERISFSDEEDNLNENYFKGYISDMIDITNLLKYDNNKDDSLPNQTYKKYL
jgi:hypothetical protein